MLNPLILATTDGAGQFIGGGTDRGKAIVIVAAGTALVAGILTILMGAVANFPLALATGLGLNTFVAVSIAKNSTWEQAMGSRLRELRSPCKKLSNLAKVPSLNLILVRKQSMARYPS